MKNSPVRGALPLLLLTAGLCSCGGGDSQDSNPGPSLAGSLQIRAADLGTLPVNPDISGRDEAYSAAFQGYSVWLYGDTFLQNADASGRTFLSNTWSYTTSFVASQGIVGFQERLDSVGSPSMLIQETPDEYSFNLSHYGTNCQVQPCGQRWAIWPSTMITDPVSNRALVFYTVQSVKPNGDFQGIGSSVAIWSSFAQLPQRPSFNPAVVAGHPDLMFSQTEPTFGSTAVISNGVLYVYGCGNDTDGLDKGCRVARVDPAAVQDRSAWLFYDGRGWSSSLGDAVPVFDGLDILSVSWNNYLQRYVAVYSALFSQNVMLRTAPSPQGPWSAELVAFNALPPAGGGDTYDAQAHSEFDADGGKTIYVTYSRAVAAGGLSSEIRLVKLDLTIVAPLP